MPSKPKDDAESENRKIVRSLLRPESEQETSSSQTHRFEDFIDEKTITSHDIFNSKEMKIKILEVSDEHPPIKWKLGDRVKVNKILVTIKHLDSGKIEEGEFDIQAIEKEMIQKSHYVSSSRWIPTTDIKNGHVTNSRHTGLISTAVALDYITF